MVTFEGKLTPEVVGQTMSIKDRRMRKVNMIG